jgi:predicted dienelactone hydrolase
MRFYEILLLIVTALMLIGAPMPLGKRPYAMIYLPLAAVVAFMAHIILEKPHWQMAPLYGLSAVLSCLFAVQYFVRPKFAPRPLVRWLGMFLGWLWLALAALLPLAMPVFKFPAPSGPYQVGTRDLYFTDTSRPEELTPEADDKREFMVRAWYPAEPDSAAQPQPYWPDADKTGPPVLSFFGLPSFGLNHLALVKTHSYLNAPLSDASEQFPVLVFSHGYGLSDFSMNLTQMEELASHGYIVFSINHTYEAWGTVFPDGRVAPLDKRAFDTLYGPEKLDLERRFITWVADTEFVLDQLDRMNEDINDPFSGRLDLNHLGVFGMSFGGATAMEVCFMDSRCKAGANMDGSRFGEVGSSANLLKTPFMFFYSEHNAGMNDYLYEAVQNRAYRVTVRGATHGNYTDMGLWTPLSRYAAVLVRYPIGGIDQRRMTQIENAYLLAFFDKHLKGEAAPLLDGPSSAFPEVDFQWR